MVEYHEEVNPPDPDKLMSPQQVSRFYHEVVHETMAVNTARNRMESGWFEDRGIRVEAWGRSLRVVRDELYAHLLAHYAGAMVRLAIACRERGLDAATIIGEAIAGEGNSSVNLMDRMDAAMRAAHEAQAKQSPPHGSAD